MALMSYVQRRRSGFYEFRKRLPQALAGKDVPTHMRDRFPDLINTSTRRFKNEFVQSLDTKEAPAAKKQAHRIAFRLAVMVEEAEAALTAQQHSSQPAKSVDPQEIGEAVYRSLLEGDEAERLMVDDRRLLNMDRATEWPDLEPLKPASGAGMQIDHATGLRG